MRVHLLDESRERAETAHSSQLLRSAGRVGVTCEAVCCEDGGVRGVPPCLCVVRVTGEYGICARVSVCA